MSKVHKLTFIKEMVDLVDETNPPGIEIHGKKFVQVVRCKDCKYNSLNRIIGNAYCNLGIELYQLDDYCSRGERRKDEIN